MYSFIPREQNLDQLRPNGLFQFQRRSGRQYRVRISLNSTVSRRRGAFLLRRPWHQIEARICFSVPKKSQIGDAVEILRWKGRLIFRINLRRVSSHPPLTRNHHLLPPPPPSFYAIFKPLSNAIVPSVLSLSLSLSSV